MEPKFEKGKTSGAFLSLSAKLASFVYFALLIASILYIWAFTADRYVSTAEFRISENKSSVADAGLLELALPGLVDSRSLDSKIAISYIASADLLLELEERFDLKKHFSAPETDFFFRLNPNSNLEERLEYYRDCISAHYNDETGLTVISIKSFSPEYSEEIARFLLKESEEFVNRVNQQIADRQFEFLHKEFERAAKNLDDANHELTNLQNRHNFISPEQMITSAISAIESMRLEMLSTKAEIASLVRDSPNSPRIDLLESQLRSIEELIEIENSKLSGPEKDRLNKISQEFEFVKKKIEFRAKLLAGSELLLEKNRNEAIANSKFFTVIQTPFLPEDAVLPKRMYMSVTILVIGILVFIILRILMQSVLERG
ncbi:hypothetical protein [Luteolibacter sp. AS25]|uniref:hypothetical protein n=1 Tax=Luteolibacter sp. AS25 TaxID=3135776 RepID=UPI00398B7E9D